MWARCCLHTGPEEGFRILPAPGTLVLMCACVFARACMCAFCIIPGVIPGRILLPVTVASVATVPLGKYHAKLHVQSYCHDPVNSSHEPNKHKTPTISWHMVQR